jgi:hypothetical protein
MALAGPSDVDMRLTRDAMICTRTQ